MLACAIVENIATRIPQNHFEKGLNSPDALHYNSHADEPSLPTPGS